MELRVIDFKSEMYPQVIELRNRILRFPLGLTLSDEDLTEDRDQYIIVMIKEELVTACVMLKIIDAETIKLRQMAVDIPFQRTGLGSLLIGYAENFCVLNDYLTIELNARSEAVNFYKKNGYARVGGPFEEVGILHYKMIKQLVLGS